MSKSNGGGIKLHWLLAGATASGLILSHPQAVGETIKLDPTFVAALVGVLLTFANRLFPSLSWLWEALARIFQTQQMRELSVLASLESRLEERGDHAGCKECQSLMLKALKKEPVTETEATP